MKHLLMSIIIVLIAAPALAARVRDPRRGARRMLVALLAFHLAYVAYVTLVHAPYYVPVDTRPGARPGWTPPP